MVFDPDLCIGCNACTVECRRYYNLTQSGAFRLRIEQVEEGSFPNVESQYVRNSCAHCDNPVCVENCPTGATYKAEDGFVVINKEMCIGCGICVDACPYEARYLELQANELKADKCSFCYSRVAEGDKPVCVTKCITEALTFGKTSEAEMATVLMRQDVAVYAPEHGTKPQLYHTDVREHRKDLETIVMDVSW
jgi:tetrathionate reductase subunit B